MVSVSVVVPYRDRIEHLASFLEWCASPVGVADDPAVEVLVVEGDVAPTQAEELAAKAGVRYAHLPCDGPFHKTRLLNAGLAMTSGPLVMAYDVDLLPVGDTFARHVRSALRAPDLLLTAHRLMSPHSRVSPADIVAAARHADVAPEDRDHCVYRHLLTGERFGIAPALHRDRLEAIGGWDEGFVGWGGEDQDLLERYCGHGEVLLVRSPDLVYLHLHHEHAAEWNELRYVMENRRRYYSARGQRWDG